jgi:SagB-type dehydrogenase family enzyme
VTTRRALRLTSTRCVLAYWKRGELRIVNYLTRTEYAAKPVVLEILRFFLAPRSIRAAFRKFFRYNPESVGASILQLLKAQLLLECGSAAAARDGRLDAQWGAWLPAGGAYHFLTKDAPYVPGDLTVEQTRRSLPRTPQPPHFKKIEGVERIALPRRPPRRDPFFQTLHARRTGRTFSGAQLPLKDVSTLLRMTWGVQGYVHTTYFGPLPLKTSPSGGARHPVEVYLLALRVKGLAPAIYHYDAEAHELERISADATAQQARAYCADQPYAAHAAALFIMTAVFERTMWKYPHPRAYRVVLLDAGHLGQTFCLTATRLGLAPFSTAALKDTLIEHDLGIDGILESVIYVAGCGLPAKQ